MCPTRPSCPCQPHKCCPLCAIATLSRGKTEAVPEFMREVRSMLKVNNIGKAVAVDGTVYNFEVIHLQFIIVL